MSDYLIDKPIALIFSAIDHYKPQKELDHYQALGQLRAKVIQIAEAALPHYSNHLM